MNKNKSLIPGLKPKSATSTTKIPTTPGLKPKSTSLPLLKPPIIPKTAGEKLQNQNESQADQVDQNQSTTLSLPETIPLDLPLINTISLLLVSFREQEQSKAISSHLNVGLCPQTGSKLAALAQKTSQNRLQNNNKTSTSQNTSAPLQALLHLRTEPYSETGIKNMNPTSTTGSSNNTHPNSTNTKIPKPHYKIHHSEHPYTTTPLNPTDPILLYSVTRELSHLTVETSLLSKMLHKFKSQQRRQIYFSRLSRTVRKARGVISALITFKSSYFSLIYGYFDAIQADIQSEKFKKAKGSSSSNLNTTKDTSKTTSPSSNQSDLESIINQELYSSNVLNLFGSTYTWGLYQSLAKTFFSSQIQQNITNLINSLLSLYISAIKAILPLFQMVYATYLLPFCYTAAAIVSKILSLTRSLLLLIYPLYISSTPQHLYFRPNNYTPNSPDQSLRDQQNNTQNRQQLSDSSATPTITSQQLWHFILKYRVDLGLIQNGLFPAYLAQVPIQNQISITSTHPHSVKNALELAKSQCDILPPRIKPYGGFGFEIPQISTMVTDHNYENNKKNQEINENNLKNGNNREINQLGDVTNGINAMGLPRNSENLSKSQLKKLKKQALSTANQPATTTSTKLNKHTNNHHSSMSDEINIDNTGNNDPHANTGSSSIPIAIHYANYLNNIKSDPSTSRTSTLLKTQNPLFSIPSNKLSQLFLQFCHPNGSTIGNSSETDGNNGRSGQIERTLNNNKENSVKSNNFNKNASTSSSLTTTTTTMNQTAIKPHAFTSKLASTFDQLIVKNPFCQFTPIREVSLNSPNKTVDNMNKNDNTSLSDAHIIPSRLSLGNIGYYSYREAQEVLHYLFSTDSTPNSPFSYHSSSLLRGSMNNGNHSSNLSQHLTLYQPNQNVLLSDSKIESTPMSYHWYLFSTSILIHGNPHNGMVIQPTQDIGLFVEEIRMRSSNKNDPTTSALTSALLSTALELRSLESNNSSLYRPLDWCRSANDLIQKRHDEGNAGDSLSNYTQSKQPNSQIPAPKTSLTILSSIEAQMPGRKYKPQGFDQPSQQQSNKEKFLPTKTLAKPTTTAPHSSLLVAKSSPMAMGMRLAAASSSDDENDENNDDNDADDQTGDEGQGERRNKLSTPTSTQIAAASSEDDDTDDDKQLPMKSSKLLPSTNPPKKQKFSLTSLAASVSKDKSEKQHLKSSLKKRNDDYRLSNDIAIPMDENTLGIGGSIGNDEIKFAGKASSSLPTKKSKLSSSKMSNNDNNNDDGAQVSLISNDSATVTNANPFLSIVQGVSSSKVSTPGLLNKSLGSSLGLSKLPKQGLENDTKKKKKAGRDSIDNLFSKFSE